MTYEILELLREGFTQVIGPYLVKPVEIMPTSPNPYLCLKVLPHAFTVTVPREMQDMFGDWHIHINVNLTMSDKANSELGIFVRYLKPELRAQLKLILFAIKLEGGFRGE